MLVAVRMDTRRGDPALSLMEQIMKNRIKRFTACTIAAAALGTLLAAAPAMADDARSDEAIRLSTDQTEYNASIASSIARLVLAPRPGPSSTLHAADNNAKALRQRAAAPPFPGG